MHILLVRFSSMGDVLLQTSTANFLKALLGEKVRITFLTSEEFLSLVKNHPSIDEVIVFKRKSGQSWSELVQQIKQIHKFHKIHLILDVHGTLRSWRLRWSFWYIPSLVIDKRRVERFLLTKLKIPLLKKIINPNLFGLEPQVVRIINDFSHLFGTNLGVWKTQNLVNHKNEGLTSLISSAQSKRDGQYIVIAPSASFVSKRWPVKSFVELSKLILKKTDFDIIILAGPEDHFCSEFDQLKSERVLNLQGKTTLKESMDYISQAKYCIGNDSGMNHIAEAYDVSCLTLFGSTHPLFGFAPHGKKSRYVYKNLWCSPCSATGKKQCFRDQHYCMDSISPEEVMDVFLEMVGER